MFGPQLFILTNSLAVHPPPQRLEDTCSNEPSSTNVPVTELPNDRMT